MGGERADPAHIVPPDYCERGAERDLDWWDVTSFDDRIRHHQLGEAKRVTSAWLALNSGCVPDFEKVHQPLCVRPLVEVDVPDYIETRRTVLAAGDDSGVVVSLGADASILPLYGPQIRGRDERHHVPDRS